LIYESGIAYSVRITDDNGARKSRNAILTVEPLPERIKNLALQGTASQFSTNSGAVASRAIDGNTDGLYSNNSVTKTSSSFRPWWEVELAENSIIDKIVLFNRTDCCTARLDNYVVYLLNEKRQVVFKQTYTDVPDPSKVIDIGGLEGRTVRIRLLDTNVLSLAEVRVRGYVR